MTFSKSALSLLFDLETITQAQAQLELKKQERQRQRALRDGRSSNLGKVNNMSSSMTSTPSTHGKPPLKAAGLSSTQGKKTQKDVTRRLKKSLVITLLLRMQNLHMSSFTDPFKDVLLQ